MEEEVITPEPTQEIPPSTKEVPQPVGEKPRFNWKSPKVILPIIFGIVVLIGVGLGGYYYLFWGKELPPQKTEPTISPSPPVAPVIQQGKFAEFQEIAVEIQPQVADYQVKEDFSNIINFNDFNWLSEPAKNKLKENAFVVTQGWGDEFFPLYEDNRYWKTPSFVTSDSVLHTYHLLFDFLLKRIEQQKLSSLLAELNQKMLATSQDFYNQLKGTEWENAAMRNIAFFSVPAKLLDENFVIPEAVKNEVEVELQLMEKHEGIAISPVMNLGIISASGEIINPEFFPNADQLKAFKEDYTQYIPRGHYEKSDLLKKYFKAMMWYGRMTFRFKEDDEIKSAVLATLALKNNSEAFSPWEAIYEVTNFFVGKSDDIGFYQLEEKINEIYGESPALGSLSEQAKFSQLKEALEKMEPPAINSMPIYRADIQPDREKEIKGFRFMGQRFTIDASIFQRLVCREVGTKQGEILCGVGIPDSRMLPKGLDIPAALGSDEALAILEAEGETEYKNYPENMEGMRAYIKTLTQPIWTQNLYWSWLYSLLPLKETRGEGYPAFMKNLAWVRKQLNTFLGSWTELKHDTILYAKQVYAEMGAGPPEDKDDRGYVEPEPYIYARLAALTRMTKEGLASRSLISEDVQETLGIMEELCLKLKTIAEKELNGQALTSEENDFIRGYGGNLEHLFLKAMEDDCRDIPASQCLDENPAALVADVATDPGGEVLEEAIGKIFTIYVVVPVDNQLRITKGGVFSHYEFPWPIEDRLTDSKWREMLDEGEAPELPAWTEIYLAK